MKNYIISFDPWSRTSWVKEYFSPLTHKYGKPILNPINTFLSTIKNFGQIRKLTLFIKYFICLGEIRSIISANCFSFIDLESIKKLLQKDFRYDWDTFDRCSDLMESRDQTYHNFYAWVDWSRRRLVPTKETFWRVWTPRYR